MPRLDLSAIDLHLVPDYGIETRMYKMGDTGNTLHMVIGNNGQWYVEYYGMHPVDHSTEAVIALLAEKEYAPAVAYLRTLKIDKLLD